MHGIMLIDDSRTFSDIIGSSNLTTHKLAVHLNITQQLSHVTTEDTSLPSQYDGKDYGFAGNISPATTRVKSISQGYEHNPAKNESAFFYCARQNCRNQRQQINNLPSRTLAYRQMYNDLRDFNFTNINRDNYARGEPVAVDFSYANLEGADLRLAWLNGSNFTYANLNSAKLFIQSANFFGAALNGTQIVLDLPARWDDAWVETLLNCADHRGTLFQTIASVSDAFYVVKSEMMQQLIESVMCCPGTLALCAPAELTFIKNILAKEFYMQNPMIKGFVSGLIQNVINQSSGQVTLNSLSNSTLTNIIKFIFEPGEESALQCDMIIHNVFFIQLIVRSAYSDNPALQRQARNLYNSYLTREEIKPFTQKKEFGDGAGNPDWSDTQSLNYILVSGEKTMIIDHENITRMLRQNNKQGEIKWGNFFLYDRHQLQLPESIHYGELFNHHFKIFANSYRYDSHKTSLKNLLSLLELAEYDEKFYAVLSGNPLSENECLTSTDDQFRLNAIFCKVLTPLGDSVKETTLLAEHYREIIDVFQLRQAENTTKAQTLLTLAAVFCRYSSSFVFGTVKESPQVLRQYAYALMHKAHELSPPVTHGQFEDWKARLLGLHGAFSCTGVLSAAMIEHVRTWYPDVASAIVPPAW